MKNKGRKPIRRLLAGFLAVMVFILGSGHLQAEEAVTAKTKRVMYSFTLKTGSMGEYNITLSGGKMNAAPLIYYKNLLGKEVQLTKGVKVIKSGSRYIIRASLEKKTYYVKVKASVKPTMTWSRNLDKYSDSSAKMNHGFTWEPLDDSYQPYMNSGTYTCQIVYMTKEEAAVYGMNMTKNVYLKILDTSIKIAALLAQTGIKENSILWQALEKISRTKLASVAKTIVASVGGISLMPNLQKIIISDIEAKTKNYTTGLKIVVTWTQRGGYVNSYSTWNERASSICGKEYCRGKFTKLKKVKGWY